jgi:hypothetical protein
MGPIVSSKAIVAATRSDEKHIVNPESLPSVGVAEAGRRRAAAALRARTIDIHGRRRVTSHDVELGSHSVGISL